MPFQFTPADGFRNTVAFPQKPSNETAFRDQMQTPLDQIREYINSANPMGQYAKKSGDSFYGPIVLNNNSEDSPEIVFMDPINGSQASMDIYNGQLRCFAVYKGGSIMYPFQFDLPSKNFLSFGYRVTRALSGGSKIQSGTGTVSVSAGVQSGATIYFPVAFSSKPIILCSLAGATGYYGTDTTIGSYGTSANSTTIGVVSTRSQSIDYSWIAIGD